MERLGPLGAVTYAFVHMREYFARVVIGGVEFKKHGVGDLGLLRPWMGDI
jgi:hypothetical protein